LPDRSKKKMTVEKGKAVIDFAFISQLPIIKGEM
jgi:hypothetical protein